MYKIFHILDFDGGIGVGLKNPSLFNGMADMLLVGCDIHEKDKVTHFRYDLPVTFLNTVGLPVSHYFQGDFARQDFTPAPEIEWFKAKEEPYVKKLLAYDWETAPMENIPDKYTRMYHLKIAKRPPIGVSRELFWNKRRDDGFKSSFQVVKLAEQAILDAGNLDDKSYTMEDFLLTPPFIAKDFCRECAKDDDETFVFRQLNGYRNGILKFWTVSQI